MYRVHITLSNVNEILIISQVYLLKNNSKSLNHYWIILVLGIHILYSRVTNIRLLILPFDTVTYMYFNLTISLYPLILI